MKKIIAILLCAVLVLGLFAACEKKDTAVPGVTTPKGEENGVTETKKNGSFVVTANASVRIAYGTDGLVIKIEGINDSGKELVEGYDEMLGASCATLVGKVIKDSAARSNLGRLNYVVVKHEKDSGAPGTNFLEGVEAAAKKAVEDTATSAKLFMVTKDLLDADGYINLQTAKALIEAFLGVESLQSFDGTNKPIDGFYSFQVSYDGMEEMMHMDAVTGGVGQGEINGALSDATEPEETEPQETEPAGSEPVESTAPVVTEPAEVPTTTPPTVPVVEGTEPMSTTPTAEGTQPTEAPEDTRPTEGTQPTEAPNEGAQSTEAPATGTQPAEENAAA